MLLFVPVVAAAEMLDMKAKLPEYQVRGTELLAAVLVGTTIALIVQVVSKDLCVGAE